MDKGEALLLGYEKICQLDKNGLTFSVMNKESGNIFVMKTISPEQIYIYNILKVNEHKNIPKVIEVIDRGKFGVVIEEFIEGKTVKEILESGERFEAKAVAKYAVQICDVLDFLNKNKIVHRDITASNVIIKNDGQVKLIDFGNSRVERANVSADTVLLGTQGYAAPEQYGFKQSDGRTDIYSLGVLINKMITGKFPTEELSWGEFREIILKATSFAPENRYQSAKTMKDEIVEKFNLYTHNTENLKPKPNSIQNSNSKPNSNLKPNYNAKPINIVKKFFMAIWYIYNFIFLVGIFMGQFDFQEHNTVFRISLIIFWIIVPHLIIIDFKNITRKIPFIKKYTILRYLFKVLLIYGSFILGLLFYVLVTWFL